MSAPDFTPDELATLQRIEAADPAPEAYIGSDGLTIDERRKWMPRLGNGINPEPPRWLAFDIGCIECGESSSVVGVYGSQDEAHAAVTARSGDPSGEYFAGGQHSVEVFEL